MQAYYNRPGLKYIKFGRAWLLEQWASETSDNQMQLEGQIQTQGQA